MAPLFASNMALLYHLRVQASPHKVALSRKRRGQWVSHTWEHVDAKVSEIAWALQSEGLKKGDRIVIFSPTRIDWTLVDWAALTLGLVVVPVYPSQSPDDLDLILQNVQASVIFFEDRVQLSKLAAIAHRLSFVKRFVSFEALSTEELGLRSMDEWIQTQMLQQIDFAHWRSEWRKSAESILPGDLLTISFTSGTTGKPKGAELTHYNFVSNLKDCIAAGIAEPTDSTLLFLPLSHILGRVEQMLALAVGWRLNYAQNFSTLFEDMQECSPTVLFSVPRVFEQMLGQIKKNVDDEPVASRLFMHNFFNSLHRYAHAFEAGDRQGWLSRVTLGILDRVLFKRIREKFGGNIRYCLCGGAPLSAEVARFFHLAGVRILEGYGLTESTGPVAVNRPNEFKFGSVGRPLPSVSVRIATDGEIMLRGPAVMTRYHDDPTSESSFDGDFYKTGDIGRLDSEGFLFITDRKKDIIITSGGKNISPQKIETRLKDDPLVSHALIAGDDKNYLVALLTLNSSEASELAREQGLQFHSVEDLYQNPAFKRLLSRRIEKVNQDLASYESIRRFAILGRELSAEAGELTPSFKIRRKFCLKKFSKTIEQLYD